MTQKLPKDWKHETTGDGCKCAVNEFGVLYCIGGELVFEVDCLQRAPAAVPLALIRNAHLDPIFEAAKRVVAVAEDYPKLLDEIDTLKRLIDESEEP